MSKFKKIIQEAPTVSSENLQRSGNTTSTRDLPFFDGRSLRRTDNQQTKQFNLRLKKELLEELYQQAAEEKKTLTRTVEEALIDYLERRKR